MFHSIPAGYKAVQVRFNDTVAPLSTRMSVLPADVTSSAGQRYDDTLLYDVRPSSGMYASDAQISPINAHFSSMLTAAGRTGLKRTTYNPIPACLVGGYLPSACRDNWAPTLTDFGAFEAAVEGAYCSAAHSLTRMPTEAILVDVLIPEAAAEPDRSVVYTAATLNTYLKGL